MIFPFRSGKIEPVEMEMLDTQPRTRPSETPHLLISDVKGRELLASRSLHGTILPGLIIGMVPIGPGSLSLRRNGWTLGISTGQKEGKITTENARFGTDMYEYACKIILFANDHHAFLSMVNVKICPISKTPNLSLPSSNAVA